ncbi:Protein MICRORCHIDIA 4 [Ancistrocladus abbreviatus]
MDVKVKQEILEQFLSTNERRSRNPEPSEPVNVINLSSNSSGGGGSSSSSDSDDSDSDDAVSRKRLRVSSANGGASSSEKQKQDHRPEIVLPVGFLEPIVREVVQPLPQPGTSSNAAQKGKSVQACKQFWKAGDYEGAPAGGWDSSTGGMDHVRVHPKFLHSNATSHKWALGAFAELLDNSLDEVCNGATFVNVDMVINRKDGCRMLLIEDNGGGMDPDKMRQCMSLGYSAKSKLANTIGQYGNGFKTSTMRLGADVIVFSRCVGKDGKSSTQSIGLLSYTFLRSTGKEDIVVPILDYEKRGGEWNKLMRSSAADWSKNVETIVQWSPYSSEANLLQQFNLMKDHGTRIIIYNLWEDDQGELELDFDSDPYDIQIRGVNRDERNIQMAKEHPNSRHFLTYRHSLRSYVSILYLRLPHNFRIILRGKDVNHHNVVNDMMMSTEITYRPQPGAEGVRDRDPNMLAVVTIGFVKDAKAHVDVQGFNVYHKNRLIKPFWRVWNAAGSDGRGVIGVLEANFVEPAHDKQGFERTTVLARLEAKLLQLQKTYWSSNCHLIGYAPRRNKKEMESAGRDTNYVETSPDYVPHASARAKRKNTPKNSEKSYSPRKASASHKHGNGHLYNKVDIRTRTKSRGRASSEEPSSPSSDDDNVQVNISEKRMNGSSHPRLRTLGKGGAQTAHISLCMEHIERQHNSASSTRAVGTNLSLPSEGGLNDEHPLSLNDQQLLDQLKEENWQLKERLNKKDEEVLADLLHDLHCERERCRSLEAKLQAAERKIDELNKEQESLIDIFSEERDRRDIEEENLRKKLKDASNTIQELLDKMRHLENTKSQNSRF